MPCYHPLKGYRSVVKHDGTGKPTITFNPLKAINSHDPITLPCGNCTGCRIDRVDQWATRCMHESQMHLANSFITLTYANEHLPEDYSVHVREFQLFMKRLRKDLAGKVRYYACGEYGEENLRPHYHAILFGYDFPDRTIYQRTKDGILYQSEQLSKTWGYGLATLGEVSYKSAAYVAGYCMKKLNGDQAANHYWRTHPLTRSAVKVEPEFALMSSNPGIGSTWFDKFQSDCFPSDFIVIDGREKPVPRYYLKKLNEGEQTKIKRNRKLSINEHGVKSGASLAANKANRSKERLAVREYIKQDRLSRLKRTLKDDEQ